MQPVQEMFRRFSALGLTLALFAGCGARLGADAPPDSLADADAGTAANGGAPDPLDGGSATPGPGPTVDPTEVVFDRDKLHEISITTDPANLASLGCPPSETRVSATLTFDGVTLTNVGIRNKGQTSCRPPSDKLGFSIKFNEFVAGQRLHGLKRLTLNNAVQDPTWVNELLTYDTYKRAGLVYQRVAHAVVTFNGTPKGIYTIVESVNEQFLERHFGKGFENGNLYEGPWDFDESTSVISLKDEVAEARSRADIEALATAVLSPADSGFPDRLAPRLDIDRFVMLHAVDMVTVAWDGYTLDGWNYYLYDNPKDNRFVYLGTGSNWPYFTENMTTAINFDPLDIRSLWPDGSYETTGFLSRRVLLVPALKARLQTALVTARAAFNPALLKAEFDRTKRTLNSTTRTDSRTRADLATFNANVAKAYEFVDKRTAYLLTRF